VGELVLLLNSQLKLFPGKLKSKWTSPYTVIKVYGIGAIKIEDVKGVKFKINGQRLKVYFGEGCDVRVDEVLYLYDA